MAARLTLLLNAAKAARKQLARDRRIVVTSHSSPAGTNRPASITDPFALAWISEYDAAIAKLDRALALYAEGSAHG